MTNRSNIVVAAALCVLATVVSCATTSTGSAGTSASTPKTMSIPNVINWQGTNYSLSWSNDVNGLAILEYLSAGETTEKWETMITIQISGETAAKAVQAFIESSKPLRTEDVRLMKNDTTGDILVDTLLFDTTNDYLEHNLIKFSKLRDGRLIKVFFQTRVKISDATANKTLVSEKIGKPRMDRLNFLSSFKFE